MADNSSIEWTEATWNPVTGCTRVSPGCDNCYAVTMSRRLEHMGVEKYAGLVNQGKTHFNGRVRLHYDALDLPLRWRKPRKVFVNSMSDLFHEQVPLDFIRRVFDVMAVASAHTFQLLTKRGKRLRELAPDLDWPTNVWMGVSVEHDQVINLTGERPTDRIDDLRSASAAVRFLSCEPLLGPLPELDLDGIHWVIVGGESGHRARPMRPEWVSDIREQCDRAGVPFFFKQWGAYDEVGRRVGKNRAGRSLDGATYDGFPVRRAA
jgi:protein gp37